jgi:hypothetical protein
MSDVVRQIADAILYEGHVLFPYRLSSTKNRQRWTFGGIYPAGYAKTSGDRSTVRFECVVEGASPQVEVEVRFLQILARGDRDEARRLYLAAAEGGVEPLRALLSAAELSPWGQRFELLRRAISVAPDDPEPRHRLVAALVASGQASAAAAAAAELAELLHRVGDTGGALEALRQARRLDPWNAGLVALEQARAEQEQPRP